MKEDMQSQFGDILADIHHRQSNLDFSPLLEEIKATQLGVVSAVHCLEVASCTSSWFPAHALTLKRSPHPVFDALMNAHF